MTLVVERQIQASPERVWELLTDPEVLTSGDFGIAKVDGSFELGSKIKITAVGEGENPLPFKVVRREEPYELSLKLSMVFGLIAIQTTVVMEPKQGGTLTELSFGTSGLLGRKFNAKLNQLNPQGEKFLAALAAAAEAPAADAG